MYSLLIGRSASSRGRLYRMSFQRLNAGLTERPYGALVPRSHLAARLVLLVVGFVLVLVLAGQLARAANPRQPRSADRVHVRR
jgi:hypothetical protein